MSAQSSCVQSAVARCLVSVHEQMHAEASPYRQQVSEQHFAKSVCDSLGCIGNACASWKGSPEEGKGIMSRCRAALKCRGPSSNNRGNICTTNPMLLGKQSHAWLDSIGSSSLGSSNVGVCNGGSEAVLQETVQGLFIRCASSHAGWEQVSG